MIRTFFFLAAGLAAVAAHGQAPAPIEIRVYHTNDVHGWIMPRPDKRRPGALVGGAAALKAAIAADRGPKLVLDAGDWWQGTPEGSLTKGEAVAEVFNAVGYDAVEIGNHDFDDGFEPLKALIGRFKMPVLAANIYGADGKRVPWAKPRVIREVAGVKFGVFGLLTVHMDKLAFPKHIAGLTFRREIDEARDQVRALKAEGADVVIALTHVGLEEPGKPKFEDDRAIAAAVEGIDLIVGGHSHTSLSPAWRDPAHGTLVVQAGSYLTKFGRTTLRIDPKTRRVADSSDELVELAPERLGEDAGVKEIVARRLAETGEVFKLVVATASADLNRGIPDRESGLGSWMADCYRETAGADIAFQNGGGMRADIGVGPVTLRDLFNVMPFDNVLVKLKMTGAQVRAVLDRGAGGARVMQVSGVSARYRRGRPARERVEAASVGDAPLDDKKIYDVVTVDFLVTGGDGYQEFGAAAQEPTGLLARDALRACAEKRKTISPPEPGRLINLGN